MKNPFEKKDHKVLITGILIGSLAAGAAAYLFLTETGASIRKEITGYVDKMRTAFIGDESTPEEDHSKDYLQHSAKKPKSDREALLKHGIIGTHNKEQQDEQNEQA